MTAPSRSFAILVRASVTPLRQPTTLLPAATAVVLPVLMIGILDVSDTLLILRWTGLLLACVLLASLDDPSGEVLAASPYPRVVRSGARLTVAAVVVVPSWMLAAALSHWREPFLPLLPVALEALGVALLGVAIAAALQAWRGLLRPSQVAAMMLLAAMAAFEALPRWYVLNADQTWGPPWEAAHLRWAAVLLLALAVVTPALRDPLRRD